jgi:hypothetical protein
MDTIKGKIVVLCLGIVPIIVFGWSDNCFLVLWLAGCGTMLVIFGDWIGDHLGSPGIFMKTWFVDAETPGWALVVIGWVLLVMAYVVGLSLLFKKW